jgi:protein-glutamine gamma-glutamyltransferase
MTLSRMVRLVGVLLVVTASFPLLISGELPGFIWPVLGVGLGLGFLYGDRKWRREMVVSVTTLLIGSFVLLFLFSLQTGEWLINSITFALFATVARAMQLTSSRQYFQLVGLSFLILIASAVTYPDLSFAFFFVVYAVLLTWALTYTHVVQQVEESPEATGIAWKASRFVSRRFLLGSSSLALVLLMASMVIFFLFPRLGLGFFSAQVRRGDSISGFSESLELGHFGNLKESSRVVLRLEIYSGMEHIASPSSMKLRGITFDRYDGKGWHKTSTRAYQLRAGRDGFHQVWGYPTGKDIRYDLVEYDVYQEPLDVQTKVMFGLVRPLEIRPVANRFDRFRGTTKTYYVDEMLDLSYKGPGMTSISYTVRSGILRVAPDRLRAQRMLYSQSIRKLYLQLPRTFDKDIGRLAREVTAGADNPYDMALAIEDHLQNNYGYTTEGEGEPGDPISSFLFERKEGHCEYFATAMVLMLRSLDIPARPVNGFMGGQYNDFGEYYTVTEAAAHSWVEIYFPQYGWITFDPTPAVETIPQSSGFFGAVELWVDALKLEWYKWIVEYDLERQISFYAGVWNMIAPETRQIELSPDYSVYDMRRDMKQWSKKVFVKRNLVIMGLLLAVLIALRIAIYRFRRRRRVTTGALDALALKLRRLLAAKGLTVQPGSTLPSLVRQAVGAGFPATSHLACLVVELEEARWMPDSGVDLRHLKQLLTQIKRS